MANTQELKEQAIAYYNRNKVPSHMQDVLNTMFHANPQDVNGYVSNYFEELSITPTITRALAIKFMDNKGCPSIAVRLYCLVRNKEKLVGESHICIDTTLMDNAKVEDKEAEDLAREAEVDEAINLINNDFRDVIASENPCQQQQLDDTIYELIETRRLAAIKMEDEQKEAEMASPQLTVDDDKKGAKKSGKGSGKKKNAQVVIIPDKAKQRSFPGWTSVTALSQALCMASATLTRTSMFDHLIRSYGGDDYSVRLPLPVISLLHSGKAALGKSNCVKEYMIVPRPDMPLKEAIAVAVKLHDAILKALYAKVGVAVKNLNDFGALCPTLDKPEQGLDMIAENISQLGFEMGTDFFFILNSAAHDYFDYEKGKYEVLTGAVKVSEDMADFWADLCNRYPSIIGIIDPVRPEEKASWNKVCAAISDRCLILTDHAYSRPGLLKNENLDLHEFSTSGIVMRLVGCNTLTHMVECAKKMSDLGNTIMLAEGLHESNDTVIIDAAIASKARFIKMGAPNRGERMAKFNKLLELEEELGERRAQWEPLEFPTIPPKLPTPTPDSEEIASPQD